MNLVYVTDLLTGQVYEFQSLRPAFTAMSMGFGVPLNYDDFSYLDWYIGQHSFAYIESDFRLDNSITTQARYLLKIQTD